MTFDPHANQPVLEMGKPLAEATGAVILIHGRGGSAEDILGLANALPHPGLAYLAPEAAGHSWYPNSFLAPIERNEPWLTSALRKLSTTIESVMRAGIRRERIIVAGFSQGACLASEFVARNAVRHGGLIAFTGGLIGPPGTKFHYQGNLAGTPVFFGSGDPDPHVPWERVQESASILAEMGAEVILKRYPGMPHTVSQQEIEEAKDLIARAFKELSIETPR